MKGSLGKIVVLLVAAALGVGAASAATRPKPCKPKTAKKCKKHVVAKPAPKAKPTPTTSTASTTTTTTAAPTPGVTVTMGSDLPDPPAAAIRRGIEIAQAYLPQLGAPASWHVDLYVEASLDAIAADALKATGSDSFTRSQCPNGCGFVLQRNKVFIYPLGSSFPRPDETAQQMKTPVHELWHTVQYALAPTMDTKGADGLFLDGPNWLREGSADYVGYLALSANAVDVSPLRQNSLYHAKNTYAGTTLASTASGQGNEAAYDLGFFAVELLLRDTGGTRSLIDYWTKIGQGVAWPAAFQQVFGRSIDQFYSEFETYRQSL